MQKNNQTYVRDLYLLFYINRYHKNKLKSTYTTQVQRVYFKAKSHIVMPTFTQTTY